MTHGKTPTILIIVILLFEMISCQQKDISVDVLPYDSKPIIECMITPGKIPQLYLNSSVPFFDPRVDNHNLVIRNAFVLIESDLSSDTLVLDSIQNLFTCQYEYFYKGHELIEMNKTYNLTLKTGGITYQADATTDQIKVNVTSTDYTPIFQDIYGEHEGVIVDFTDVPNERNYYRYQMARLIDSTVTYGEAHVYSLCTHGSFFNVLEIGRAVYNDGLQDGLIQQIVVEPAYKHSQNAEGYISIQTLDENAAKFYDELDKQKLGILNPFVEPVLLKPIQFENAIGVFGAYAISDSVLFIYPE